MSNIHVCLIFELAIWLACANAVLQHVLAGKEAQLLFSCLLSVLGTDAAAQGQFAEGWTKVPLHMLLPWAAQMLSLLDGHQGEALLPLLQVCCIP